MRYWQELKIFLFCALFCVAFSHGAAHSETIDRIVAVVNGEIILYSEIQEQLKIMEKMVPNFKIENPEMKAKVEREVLEQLIRKRLTEEEVRRLKIIVSSAEVDQSVQSIKDENHFTQAQFEAALKQSGETYEKFREKVKKELERSRLLERALKSKVVITDEQVDSYLRTGGASETLTPKKVRLGIILLPLVPGGSDAQSVEKTGREVLEKLNRGEDFRKLAVEYSKGPSAKDGGDIGYIAFDELSPAIADAIKGLAKGGVSDLLRGQGGFFLVKVFDIETDKQDKSDPVLREKVRRELFQKEVNRKFEEWVRNLESKAFIQISL